MITIERMVEIIANNEITYIKTSPDDSIRVFQQFKCTKERLVGDYPAKYRNDLIGFDLEDDTYYPRFATMQDEWENEKRDYIARKAEWCRKYGSN